ncbi:hypothetical protein ASG25_15965 [Rhizobium sp. Leaf384]|uniref:DUF4168 domain-containing protein n=1 Tax=unclassified Rhizobium TaxID=2613769 RepID=UPI0007161A71|nr:MULTISPECIES: DUF4168 domain-containing protein [unclassified Rhizobium]KQR69123.1 hypothetical protein ASG03_07905 [Rhizobium sp. Leaf341]KQS76906.1 hypothetical protein ASG25_15965 [Rhizobium sp. Leaf384]KQS78177.1 hypothetical protein ASG58_07180 [Rhizobium sp. Leaf383]
MINRPTTTFRTRVASTPVASLTAALLGVLVVQSPAFAQGAAEPQATQPQTPSAGASQIPAPQASITDEKLKAFAVAYLQVDKVRQDYTRKIGTTTDAAAKQKLQNEANQQMIKAVETSPGMSLNDYKTIITAAQSDPTVARKVQENLQKSPTPAD